MKNKRSDEILAAAFGELEGGLGTTTDAERTEIERMRAVKEGLRSLRDVPECQLSNERLRSAILGSAVRPRRNGVWGLATVGIAAVALAALFFRTQFAPASERTALAGPTTGAPKGTEPAPPVDAAAQPSIVNDRSDRSVVAKNDSTERSALSVGLDERDFQPQGLKEFVPVSFGSNDKASLEAADMTGASVEQKPAIVVVDTKAKTRNGAAKATEVSSYGDVVFGG